MLFKPPEALPRLPNSSLTSVFLGGVIEEGRATNWQTQLTQTMTKAFGEDGVIILNPRRDDWDDSWVQSIHDEQFRFQVSWELTAQEGADVRAYVFLPDFKAPITLMELGLFVKMPKTIVYCPEGYWRKGNVDIVCNRYSPVEAGCVFEDWQEFEHRLIGLVQDAEIEKTLKKDAKMVNQTIRTFRGA